MSFLLVVIAVLSVCHIGFELLHLRRANFFTKPATMIMIMLLCWQLAPIPLTTYSWLILGGLIFSLIGDIFLLFPEERFVHGLGAFLVAHLFHIGAFFAAGASPAIWSWPLLLTAAFGLNYVLWPRLGKLRWPVVGYMTVIIIMAASATGLPAHPERAVFGVNPAAIGAFLFVFSDSCLALRKFYKPLPASPFWVMGSYFLAQVLIASSV